MSAAWESMLISPPPGDRPAPAKSGRMTWYEDDSASACTW
jgi:hypothetical protein